MIQKIIVLSGLPGSGKSAAAEGIAKKLGIPLLSVDPIESAIIKAGITKSYETGLAAYIAAKALAAEQLKLGNSVVIDAVNLEEEAKDVWRSLARGFNLRLTIIETSLEDVNEHRKRIESRVRNLPGIPEVTWDKVLERQKAYTEWREPMLKLDSSNPLDTNVNLALGYIQQ